MNRVNRYLIFLALLFSGLIQAQRSWSIDAERSSVKFTISNFGIDVEGSFAAPLGIISFTPTDPSSGVFNVSVDPKTVDTGIKKRDKHLRNTDFFEVEKYPEIRFESTSISKVGEDFTLKGKLTIRDVTKDVLLPFSFQVKENMGMFTGKFILNRKDYGLGGMMPSGKEVTVEIMVVVSS